MSSHRTRVPFGSMLLAVLVLVAPATVQAQEPSADQLEILDSYWERQEGTNTVVVKGQVRNNGNVAAGVELMATAYDGNGRVLDSTTFWPASVNNIPAAATWPVDHPLTEMPNCERVTLRVVRAKHWD